MSTKEVKVVCIGNGNIIQKIRCNAKIRLNMQDHLMTSKNSLPLKAVCHIVVCCMTLSPCRNNYTKFAIGDVVVWMLPALCFI